MPTYLIFAASAALNGGNIKRAEELNAQATQCAEGEIDEAYCNLGGIYIIEKRYEEALQCYRRALEIDPDYARARNCIEDIELILAREGANTA